MQILYGNTADVSFPSPNTVGDLPYSGPLTWMLSDNNGVVTVDPVSGGANSAVSATVDQVDPQVLHISKVAEGVSFSIVAQYDGAADGCSVIQSMRDLQWSAPSVFVNPMCVTVTG